MKMGKALAVSAVSGILMGVLAGCGGDKPADPKVPSTDTAAPDGTKASCSGKDGTPAPAGGDATKSSCSGKGSCSGKSDSTPPKTN